MLIRSLLALLLTVAQPAGAAVRVNGSTTVNPVVSAAAELLRREKGTEIRIDTLGGSSGGIAALADGLADLAMSSRPISAEDRRRHPGIDFRSAAIGLDALALVVSRDVWEAGIRSLSREEVRGLYEGRISNWQVVGGPDRRVIFFDKEPGRGTWEVFATWLYGSAADAPLVSHPEVGSNEEARTKVAGSQGAISQLSAAWADGERVFPLALREASGEEVLPSREAVAAGRYELARTLFVVTDGPPRGEAAKLVDFLLGPRGQRLVEEHGFLPVALRGAEVAP